MPILYVDSTYRASGTSTDFSWELPESMLLRRAKVKFTQLRVPVLFYTVDSNNCHLYIEEEVSLDDEPRFRVVTIPAGNYNGQSLACKLQELLGGPAKYHVHYDCCRNSLLIERVEKYSGLTLTMSVITNSELATVYGDDFVFPEGCSRNRPKSFNRNLRHPSDTVPTPTSLLCPSVDLQTHPDLYLRCNALADPRVAGPPSGSRDIVAKLSVLRPFGSVAYDDGPEDHWHEVGALSLRTFGVALTDAQGVPVDLHGAPISFTVLIRETDQPW